MLRRAAWYGFFLAACVAPEHELPEGQCRVAIWGQPLRDGADLSVVGSWSDWGSALPMRAFGDGWWVADFGLPPGEHRYLVVEEGQGRIDPHNPLTDFRRSDGLEVSWLDVAPCESAAAEVTDVVAGSDSLRFTLEVSPGRDAWVPGAEDIVVATAGSASVSAVGHASFTVDVAGLPPGKHAIDIAVGDGGSRRAVGWVQPRAATLSDEIVYQVMIDRFRGDAGGVLAPPPDPGARAGGTLDGVRGELEAGTFDALGVSTLWLSPVYTNPTEARPGADGHDYEGYHGYWPLRSRQVEPRIGGEAALTALVEAAHARGIRVLLDLVPNHVYESNPRVAQQRPQGWFHDSDPQCVCGSDDCPWSRFIQTCWFTPYLPDFRFQTPGVLDQAIDDALWWRDRFDIDGFRVDAVPMMPRAVTRRIAHAMREAEGTPGATTLLGEVFTGSGTAGTEAIRFYLGPDGLDSAFDFPLMWALRRVVAQDEGGFEDVEASLQHTEQALTGSGSAMSLIVGNHDTSRFISVANGDDGADPWSDTPAQTPADEDPYARLTMALGLLLTLPGVPVLYYGDEVGLPGGPDPGSRRVMPSLDELTADASSVLDEVRRFAQLRRCSPALRHGTRRTLWVAPDQYAFAREHEGETVIVALNRAATPATLPLATGEVTVAPLSIDVELRGSSCST